MILLRMKIVIRLSRCRKQEHSNSTTTRGLKDLTYSYKQGMIKMERLLRRISLRTLIPRKDNPMKKTKARCIKI